MRKNFQNLGSGCETTRGIEQLKNILERLNIFIHNSHVLDLPFSTIFKCVIALSSADQDFPLNLSPFFRALVDERAPFACAVPTKPNERDPTMISSTRRKIRPALADVKEAENGAHSESDAPSLNADNKGFPSCWSNSFDGEDEAIVTSKRRKKDQPPLPVSDLPLLNFPGCYAGFASEINLTPTVPDGDSLFGKW